MACMVCMVAEEVLEGLRIPRATTRLLFKTDNSEKWVRPVRH
jgi:hypothetical protein